MHDHPGQVGDARHVAQQLVRLEEGVVDEIVAFDAGDGQRPVRIGEAIHHLAVGAQRGGAPLPAGPGLGGVHLGDLVAAGQAPVERGHQVVALVLRDRRQVILPVVGEQPAGAFLVEPAELVRAAQEDAAQDQCLDPLGMGLRVGQRQGRPPGAAEQHPALDAQVLADALHVLHQVPGGVVLQAGVRRGAPAAALVEGDDAVQGRVEVAPAGRIAAGPRPAVDEHHRQPVRRAALVDVEDVGVFHRQLVPRVGLDLREQGHHG